MSDKAEFVILLMADLNGCQKFGEHDYLLMASSVTDVAPLGN